MLGVLTAAFGTMILISASDATAQQRGNSAANRAHAGHGWANRNAWAHRNADRRIGHAIEYSRDLRDYATVPRTEQPASVPMGRYPVVVTEEVGRNINAAKQDLAAAKQAPAIKDNAEAQQSFAAIEKHLDAAAKQHAEMMNCCSGDECDGEALVKCCEAAIGELEKAKAENSKLMKKLYPEAKSAASQEHAPADKRPSK
jgi:hypothetical protein